MDVVQGVVAELDRLGLVAAADGEFDLPEGSVRRDLGANGDCSVGRRADLESVRHDDFRAGPVLVEAPDALDGYGAAGIVADVRAQPFAFIAALEGVPGRRGEQVVDRLGVDGRGRRPPRKHVVGEEDLVVRDGFGAAEGTSGH